MLVPQLVHRLVVRLLVEDGLLDLDGHALIHGLLDRTLGVHIDLDGEVDALTHLVPLGEPLELLGQPRLAHRLDALPYAALGHADVDDLLHSRLLDLLQAELGDNGLRRSLAVAKAVKFGALSQLGERLQVDFIAHRLGHVDVERDCRVGQLAHVAREHLLVGHGRQHGTAVGSGEARRRHRMGRGRVG